MNSHMRIAIGEAMTRLKTADVAGATAAIQRALSGLAPQGGRRPEDGEANSVGFKAPAPRRLGDVIGALRSKRAEFSRGTTPMSEPGPEVGESNKHFPSRSYRGAGGSLTYKLYVPGNHHERELALVMMLHGCTQDPDDFARGTRMNELADEFGLIVAYPCQPRSANAQGCWNWFDRRHQQRGSGEPAMLAGLAQELAIEFKIDPSRIFAAGLSAGGAMADVLASTYPDVFSAVGIHSGLPHGAATDVVSAFNAMKGKAKTTADTNAGNESRKIIFHGTSDATVHASNGDAVFDRARTRHPKIMDVTTNAVMNGKRVTRTLLCPTAGAALAEHWIIQGGGHAWSGGDNGGSFTDATGPDASREMIRFFLER